MATADVKSIYKAIVTITVQYQLMNKKSNEAKWRVL